MKIIKSVIKRNVLLLNNNPNDIPWIGTVVLPYRHDTTEKLQKVLR